MHFSDFANVEKVALYAAKGYAFLTFSSKEETDMILKLPQQFIDGKTVQVKAYTSGEPKIPASGDRLFVGGLPPAASEAELKGSIREGPNHSNHSGPFEQF